MNEPKKLEVKDAQSLANELVRNSDTKPELKRVEVPDKPPLRVDITAWEKVWAVLQGALNTKVKDAADGKRVEVTSLVGIGTGVKWVVVGGMVVFILALLFKIF